MQQHGRKCFARRTPSPTTLGDGFKSTGITKCSNMVATILPADPRPPYPRGQKVKFNFSGQCHGAYQIKGNHECSNMVATILPATPPPSPTTLGDEVKRSDSRIFGSKTSVQMGHYYLCRKFIWNGQFVH